MSAVRPLAVRARIASLIASGTEILAALRRGDCLVIDGHAWFNRPGPRLVEGLEVLASRIHQGFELTEPPTVGEGEDAKFVEGRRLLRRPAHQLTAR